MILKTELLPHQQEAYDKLIHLKVGALYMEMGTGKTRTALELIKNRLDAGKITAVIWLCPCSVKANLLADIHKHSDLDQIPGVLHVCGIETLSTSVKWNQELLMVAAEEKTMLVVDESSLVKNHASLRSIHITGLAKKCPYRIILNGTPISRNEADLFSQWYLLDWRILGYQSYWSFSANHLEFDKNGRIRRTLNVDYLREKIAPYTYQCLKEDVMVLPEKKAPVTYNFCLTNEQEENYDEVTDALLMDLDAIHPETIYRLFGALQSITSGFTVDAGKPGESIVRYPCFRRPEDNPRIMALLNIVEQDDDKVLIFCTYTEDIREAVAALNNRWPGSAVSFTGELSMKKRLQNLELFRGPARFLVANKSCGSYGLNLQFCHHIVYYSHDWDWGTRAQSEDRVHRYGQTSEVHIHEICAVHTIDEQILKCLARKENLSDKFKSELSSETLRGILRGGPYAGIPTKR